MSAPRLRALAIALFVLGAMLAGVGNSTHRHLVSGLAFGAFALGVACFLGWRRALAARVLDREEKTPE